MNVTPIICMMLKPLFIRSLHAHPNSRWHEFYTPSSSTDFHSSCKQATNFHSSHKQTSHKQIFIQATNRHIFAVKPQTSHRFSFKPQTNEPHICSQVTHATNRFSFKPQTNKPHICSQATDIPPTDFHSRHKQPSHRFPFKPQTDFRSSHKQISYTFCCDVFAVRSDVFTRQYLAADSPLDNDAELLSWDALLQFLTDPLRCVACSGGVADHGQLIHWFAVQQEVHLKKGSFP